MSPIDSNIRGCLVYLKYWTLNLNPGMVYPKVLSPPNFIILASVAQHTLNLVYCLLQKVNPKLLICVQGTQGKSYPVQVKGNTDGCDGRWWGGERLRSPLCRQH